MEQHIRILGWLYIAWGGLIALVGLLFLLGAGIAGVAASTEDASAGLLAGGIGLVFALFMIVLSLPGIIAGWGLLKRKSWSRMLAIILGALNLLNIPLGTALGAYTIWALTKPESQALLNA